MPVPGIWVSDECRGFWVITDTKNKVYGVDGECTYLARKDVWGVHELNLTGDLTGACFVHTCLDWVQPVRMDFTQHDKTWPEDISACGYAQQPGALDFTQTVTHGRCVNPAPEPGATLLLLVGCVLLTAFYWWRKK